MALFKSGNPAINEKVFNNIAVAYGDEAMTVTGALKKFGLMLVMLLGAASFTWDMFYNKSHGDPSTVMPWMFGGMIGGLITAIIIIFKKEWAPYLALAYALFEGLFLGAISAILNDAFKDKYPDIISQAVLLTFGVAVGMFALYYFRILKATPLFTKIIIMATVGIAIFYVFDLILHMFGVNIAFLHDSSPLSIGISLFVVGIAALNLIMDFDLIERGAAQGAPKYFEWYGAFGLMVTIVWLYLEILRLLTKIAGRK